MITRKWPVWEPEPDPPWLILLAAAALMAVTLVLYLLTL